MLPHWDTVVDPFLLALDTGPIIEIGAASGDTTAKLAQFALERDLTLHTVDPAPQFDVGEFKRRFGENFHFHMEKSHDVLEHIEPAAAVLIDGDHNWYTVYGELTRLQRIAATADHHFPLVFLHDVEWPYARRDMYYDPDAIPEEWRQPWARRGIGWDRRSLDQTGKGVNGVYANAIEEGGPRNGVLTAVEDFIEVCRLPLEFRIVRGECGLGVLVSHNLLVSSPSVRDRWDALHSTEFLLAEVERLSKVAIREAVGRREIADEIGRLQS